MGRVRMSVSQGVRFFAMLRMTVGNGLDSSTGSE
jgi:hypothetical protein